MMVGLWFSLKVHGLQIGAPGINIQNSGANDKAEWTITINSPTLLV